MIRSIVDRLEIVAFKNTPQMCVLAGQSQGLTKGRDILVPVKPGFIRGHFEQHAARRAKVDRPEIIAVDDRRYLMPGVQQRPQQAFYDTGFFMRGQEVNFIFRDGLRLFRPPAPDNIERVEVLKGPAAVLYGESAPGGGINFISKLPRWNNAGSVELRLDSHGFASTLIDVNSVVREDSVAARFVVSGGYGDGWHDLEERNQWMVAPSLIIKFAPRSQLTLSFEHFENNRDNHVNNGRIKPYRCRRNP